MRWFYELYPEIKIIPQDEVKSLGKAYLPQVGVNSEEMNIFKIPCKPCQCHGHGFMFFR